MARADTIRAKRFKGCQTLQCTRYGKTLQCLAKQRVCFQSAFNTMLLMNRHLSPGIGKKLISRRRDVRSEGMLLRCSGRHDVRV